MEDSQCTSRPIPRQRARAKPFYRQLYFQVLAAIILGVTVGHFWPEIGASLKPLGDAFVKLVKMIIAPGDLPDRRHRNRRHVRP